MPFLPYRINPEFRITNRQNKLQKQNMHMVLFRNLLQTQFVLCPLIKSENRADPNGLTHHQTKNMLDTN